MLPSQHNPPLQDLASAITGSLSRDGLGGMRSALDYGGYRAINMADGSNDTDGATVGQLSQASIPIGSVIDFAGSAAPAGYLLCYGQEVSRSTYSALFSAIGVAWGSGNGTTTFNLPDLRGRVSAGKDDMGGSNANRLPGLSGTTLGASFGASTVTLTTGQMPTHSHGVSDPGHTHEYSQVLNGGDRAQAGGGSIGNFQGPSPTGSSNTGIAINNSGSGEAHPNVQPSAILNKIIKAL